MRTIRYFFDLGHPYPLWETGTDTYTMKPADYGLSDSLARELKWLAEEYANRFDELVAATSADQDWREQPAGAEWRRRSEAAVERLRQEVEGRFAVSDESWPA
ncbi:hypothetical protein BJY21_004142 [Kineosphaera limosa]|uniref:Uncharacterized protein n=1 Tax=Kineosphaera limosa NBRC 100340 TaxID=1184609 RepID=K6W7I0_9MICO|nr:hypothetical protein [Kineosphaera limosa]NYE02958.1 hypothetical protein [Kineosphaera limosa]GAB95150.1 hypothetical protein KILIM_016_00910 [Kineosphaera limosa NBRC 100340]